MDNRGHRLRRASTTFLFLCVAAAVAGCAQTRELSENISEGALFSKPTNLFAVPEWAKASHASTASLGPSGPVGPNDLVSASGHCPPAAPPPVAAANAQAPASGRGDAQVGSMAGDLAGAPAQAPAGPPPDRLQPAGGPALGAGAPPVMGGVALGMSECAAVRRLGTPSNVSISSGPERERRVVLTYVGGERPGLYSFESGRLKEVDATPRQVAQDRKQSQAQARRARAKSRREVQRMYVQ